MYIISLLGHLDVLLSIRNALRQKGMGPTSILLEECIHKTKRDMGKKPGGKNGKLRCVCGNLRLPNERHCDECINDLFKKVDGAFSALSKDEPVFDEKGRTLPKFLPRAERHLSAVKG